MAEGDVRDPHARKVVSVMDKEELEDRHLRLMEENLLLKKHAKSQEGKMKKMATKLLRLTADEKKEARRDGQTLASVHPRVSELEEMMEELQERNRDLEKHNTTLKNKALVLKQQIDARGKRHTPYDHIQSRISTGLGRRGQKSLSTEDISIKRKNSGSQAAAPIPRYGHSLLEEAREDNQELEELVLQLKQEIALLNAEAERNTEQFRLQEAQHVEEKLKLQEQLQAQLAAVQKSNIQEDVELIKLQRELREKSARLQSLHLQYSTVERNLRVLKGSHSKVLQEMETLNKHLKEEQSRSSTLQLELKASAVSQRTISELQEMVSDLRSEKELLKRTNDRLMKSSLASDKDQEHRLQMRLMQDRVRQLEAANKVDLSEKAQVFDKLSSERELSEKLDRELRELRTTHQRLKEEHQQLRERMKFFSKESSVDWGEVEEALVLVRGRRGAEGREKVEPLSFLERVDDEEDKDHQRQLLELRASHADTISELEKTRRLLTLQQSINKDCKKEIDRVKSHLADQRDEQEGRLREYAQLLDIKSARIKKLETQLKDIAYGTRQYKIDTSKFEHGGEDECGESVELERGQNLLQFHVGQVVLSPEALSFLNTANPTLFVTFGLHEFETQVTSIAQGARPLFNFTSNFIVTVDDTFLNHLQKGCVSVELHQAFGMKYQTLAVGNVRCRELISSAGGKVNGKVVLTAAMFPGVNSMQPCINIGYLEYWMKLKLPVTQAIRLYQERNKALSLIDKEETTPITSAPPSHGADYNELAVTVVGCTGLKARNLTHPPSPYAMYKFTSFPDHDTAIVPHSSNPVFNDTKHYPLSMDHHLDQYLRTEFLEVYVFDDLDPVETTYLGMAQVPLLELAKDKPISATFQLTEPSGTIAGSLELSLRWKLPYHTRSSSPSPPPSQAHLEPSHEHKGEPSILHEPTLGTTTLDKGAPLWSKIQPQLQIQEVNPVHSLTETRNREPKIVSLTDDTHSKLVLTAQVGGKESVDFRMVEEKSSARLVSKAPPFSMESTSASKEPSEKPEVGTQPPHTTSDHESIPETESEISAEISTPPGLPLDSTEAETSLQPGEGLQVVQTKLPVLRLPDRVGVDVSSAPLSHEDYPESVSVTVTECSEEVEEEIEESLSEGEDTMFEETLPQPDDMLSGLSAHSSDEHPHPSLLPPTPSRPSVILVEGEESTEFTPSESEDGNPVTFDSTPQPMFADPDTMAITVVNFTPTPGSSLVTDSSITQLFVEYQFLNFDYGELETTSVPEPAPGESAFFNFRKVFNLDNEQKALLAAMLKPGDPSEGRLQFTVVSDPDEQDEDCVEVGMAEVDLNTVLERGDLINNTLEVLSQEDDPEIVGHLTISVEAFDLLKKLVKR